MENKKTEFKGTRGEWYLQEYSDAYTNIVRCNDGEGCETLWICNIHGSGIENRANALLISKSPEMLEMLENVVIHLKEHDMHGKFADQIEQLIKEATEISEPENGSSITSEMY